MVKTAQCRDEDGRRFQWGMSMDRILSQTFIGVLWAGKKSDVVQRMDPRHLLSIDRLYAPVQSTPTDGDVPQLWAVLSLAGVLAAHEPRFAREGRFPDGPLA
jgi:hypothetical protein